jgi:peptidyl-prolyl cis-trans isomerase C
MPKIARHALAALAMATLVPGMAALAQTQGQTPPAGAQAKTNPNAKTGAQSPARGASAPASKPAGRDQPVATVNGEPITKSELVSLLAQFQIPPGSEQRAYESAVDLLVNTRLLEQFLRQKAAPAAPAEVEKEIQRIKQQLEQQGTNLLSALADTSTTEDELRNKIARQLQWRTFLDGQATAAALKAYFQENLDVFSGTQVRASHILIKVDPDAPAAEKEKARQTLLGIKQEIESGKIRFPDAANKYSQDDGNVAQPSGGDLGFFPRRGQFIEPFAKAAFALKTNQISDPVETEYGLHLILVTDRKPGQAVDFEQAKNDVRVLYADDLQNRIVENQRKTAEIKVEPMPPDLFSLVRTQDAAAQAAGGASTATTPAPATKPATTPAQAGAGR